MTLQFEALQSALDGNLSAAQELTGPHRRLADAWYSDSKGAEIAADIGALVSQVLRHERDVESLSNPHLRLRLDERSIATHLLARSSLGFTRYGLTEHRVTLTDPWEPEWLHGDPRWIDVACASPGPYRGRDVGPVSTYARPDDPVPADPAITAIAPSITMYRSKTQATAIRTATLGDPASTLHVVLPTGTGKSLVGLAPGMLRPDGNTVVVVPTIALALDQERKVHELFPATNLPTELAYYGDRDVSEKETIRERLRAGEQRVVFTSPEALTGALTSTLLVLAATGKLTSIVIDEAHLIRTWGLGFRPEYQLLSGLVNELRAVAVASGFPEPHVILLSATLSEEGLELNDALFHGSQESTFVGSTFLRTEIRYLMGASTSRADRLERIVEALHHLPRPAIVYVTKQSDAEAITERLRAAGFGRSEFFHGGVGEENRLRILQGWSGTAGPTKFDVIVGTSAFGLGVDQSDVRTIIHACVPAFVDRFYQEVGRAGRDGHAAVAVWLPASGDVTDGQKIEASTLIGGEKTWNRWQAMRRYSVHASEDPSVLILDTSVVPKHLVSTSDSNRLWNRNTLTLMERAGIVSLEASPPPDLRRRADEGDRQFDARRQEAWVEFRNQLRVRPTPGINLNEETFETQLGKLRAEIRTTEQASQTRINRLLDRIECWADVLSSEYTFRDVGPMRATIGAISACSGCPAEQHKHRPTYAAPVPLVSDCDIPSLSRNASKTLTDLAAGGNVVIVSYTKSLTLSLHTLIERCVLNGIRGILASPNFLTHPGVTVTASNSAEEGLVWVEGISVGPPKTYFAAPTLILLDQNTSPNLSWINPSSGPLRVVVLPEGMEDPVKTSQKIIDYRSPHWNIQDFMRRI